MERLFDKLSLPAGRLREKKEVTFQQRKIKYFAPIKPQASVFFQKDRAAETRPDIGKTEWVEEKTRSDLAKTKSDLVPTICDGAIFRTSV